MALIRPAQPTGGFRMVRTSGPGTLSVQSAAETALIGAYYIVPGAEPRSVIGRGTVRPRIVFRKSY